MSYLSEEIKRQLHGKLNQSQLATKTSISQGQISKWVNAEQTSLSPEQITALANALSDDIQDHAALVKAHLLDEKFGPGSELIRIEIDALDLRDKPKSRTKGEQALQFLTEERLSSRQVNDLIIDLARVLGAKI